MRKNRKFIAILTTLVMLVALLLPLVGPAAAATNYSADKVVKVAANTTWTGTNRVVIKGSTNDALSVDDAVWLQLPADFKMSGTVTLPALIGGDPNDVTSISVNDGAPGNDIPFANENRIKIQVKGVNPGSWVPYIYVNITSLVVPGGATGEVKLTAEAQSASGFSSGEVTIATVGAGQVTLGLDKAVLITSAGGIVDTLRVKETLAGDLVVSNESLKFKLPNGFTWSLAGASIERVWPATSPPGTVWGVPTLSDNDRTLNFVVNSASTAATYLRVSGLRINVDESVAKYGDIEVAISGKSSVTPTSAVIAKYGDYKVNVSKIEAKAVQPGMREEEIGKFALEEQVPGTIIDNRTITLTLPDKAKWDGDYPTISAADSTLLGFNISGFAAVGTDKRMIKATVSSASTGDKPTKIVFKGGEITVAADYIGDIVLEVGGSAGVSGSVVVAEAKAPITATASSKPEVKIGLPAQDVADITITEADKEILESQDFPTGNAYLEIEAPPGVRFAAVPKFEVTQGDVSLGTVTTDTDWEWLSVRVKATSTKASTIKISGIKLTVDRTVPEGDIALKIGGDSLVQNDFDPYFPNVMWAAKVVVANCVTPAPGEEKRGTVVFTIGDTKYKIGDKEETMDVAPYVKNNRTYLPVRYVAYALGVSSSNILWDNANGTVTLIKGDRVIQVQIKSKVMLINGAKIVMDVAPELKDGRTMLPFRWIAQALGASVQWDEATKTVTMKL